MAASSYNILSGIIIDLVFAILGFTAFSIFRILRCSRDYYAPRSRTPGVKNAPPELPYTWSALFGWVVPILQWKEPAIINSAGLDTAIYLRVLSFGVELFLGVSLWCLVAMLPVNLTSTYIEDLLSDAAQPNSTASYSFTEFDKCTLSNIAPSSMRMWVHLWSVYAVTIYTLWLLYKYSKESVLLRIMFLANSPKGRSTHTVLVTDIPAIANDTATRVDSIKEARKNPSNRNMLKGSFKTSEVDNRKPDIGDAGEAAAEGKGSGSALQGADSALAADGKDRNSGIGSGKYVASGPSASGVKLLEERSAAPQLRKRYTYDLKDESLNPTEMAKKVLRSGVGAKGLVEGEYNLCYPNAVQAVQLVCDQSSLEPLVEEYNKLKQGLEDYLDECNHRFDTGKTQKMARAKKLIIPMTMGKWGKEKYGSGLLKKVDAFDFYIARLRELDSQIEHEAPLSAQMVWPSAFITFTTRQAQASAATSLHHHDTATWLTHSAPEPEELLWGNLGLIASERTTRSTCMTVLFWLMCFFFMIPVAAIQAVINAGAVSDNPVLGPFVSNPVVSTLLKSIVPGLALKIFLALVPMIITYMYKFAGSISLAQLDLGVVSRYFIFQVIVVFFGSVIMGSFFNQVTQWINDPGSVVSVLGTAIPAVSTFFITYIAVNGLMVKPIAFVRIVGLAIYWILAKLSGSPKARDRMWQIQKTTLGTTVVDHTITILLGMVYCCINPIIAPFCLTYFAVNVVIERYQNIYVTTRDYESAGMLWERVFNQVMVALYLMQLVMIGLLGIKKFAYCPILIPIILATIGFHIICLSIFGKPWRLMSLHDAAELDRNDHLSEHMPLLPASTATSGFEVVPVAATGGDVECGTPGAEADKEVYLSPAFKVVPGAIEGLLAEAKAMAARVDEQVRKNEEEEAEAKRTGKKIGKEAKEAEVGTTGGAGAGKASASPA